MYLETRAIPRLVSALRLLHRGTHRSSQQTSTVTASPMPPSLDRPQGDKLFPSFWAGQTDLLLRDWTIQFRRPDSRWVISTETARLTSSLSPTAMYWVRAFFLATGMGPSNLLSH